MNPFEASRRLVRLAVFLAPTLAYSETSELWGAKGEKWDLENGLLRDFTGVGYMKGEMPIPDWPVGVDVTDYGAVADDDKDDSQAFLDAIAACPPKHAVFVPKGTYSIERQIKITEKNDFVLRGEGMYRTVLWMPNYLTEIPGAENTAFFYFDGGSQRSIENMSFILRDQPKAGHWEDLGADPIQYSSVTNSWIRNIYIKNADHAIALSSPWTKHVSVLNVVIDQYIGRSDMEGTGVDGHMGIAVFGGSYHLIDNVILTGKWHHDINAQGGKNSVWSRITGPAIGIDHHAMGAVENLWTEIEVGRGNAWNRATSIRDTYWNISAERNNAYPKAADRNVIVGGQTGDPTDTGADYWHETIDPEALIPPNIYLAQMKKVGKPLPATMPLSLPPREWPWRLLAVDDAKVEGGKSSAKNYGFDQKIQLKAGGGSTDRRGFLKYDLSELDLTSVASAKLRLYFAGLSRSPFGLQVMEVNDDSWSEETLTYGNKPPVGAAVATENVNGGGWVTLDVTSYVNSQLGGDKIVSLQLKGGAPGHHKDSSTTVMSEEGGNSAELVLYKDASKAEPPEPPTGLKASAGNEAVLLEWDENTEGDFGHFNLYRSTADKSNYEFRAGGLVYAKYQDLTAAEGETYHYRVTAVDTGGIESLPGAEQSVVIWKAPSGDNGSGD